MLRATSTSFLALVLAAGCTVGDLSGGTPDPGSGPDAGPGDQPQADAAPNAPDAAPPDYALTLAPSTAAIELGQEYVFTVSLSSERFAGPVTLAATGAPDSWNVTFAPSETIDLPLDGSAIATMTVQVPSDAEAAIADVVLTATADPGERSATGAVTVANQLTVAIADGVADGQHAFPGLATVRLGAAIRILNTDGTAHRIHSNNDNAGFPHQEDTMATGEAYEFTLNRTGQFDYYCHVHDVQAGVGAFRVIDPTPTP